MVLTGFIRMFICFLFFFSVLKPNKIQTISNSVMFGFYRKIKKNFNRTEPETQMSKGVYTSIKTVGGGNELIVSEITPRGFSDEELAAVEHVIRRRR